MSTTVLLGDNRLIGCRVLIGWKDSPLLSVESDPLAVTLRTLGGEPFQARIDIEANEDRTLDEKVRQALRVVRSSISVTVFWEERPLVIATRLDEKTVSVKIDLRGVGVNLYDDIDGLHIGDNIFAGNIIENCETAIGLT